jgi:ribosomal protein L44E
VPNRTLDPNELSDLFAPLFADVQAKLEAASAGDAELRWALRRKLVKELTYLKRGKPMQRRLLKAAKRVEQSNRCANCGQELPRPGR